jgi:hypothetical protein
MMRANMKAELALRVVLEKPPAGVNFGLQKGRGSGYETIQKQTSQGKDLYFQFTVGVKAGGNDPTPVFLGHLIQGPLAGRFVYIDIGTYAGQTHTRWSRRLKIPLSDITWELIDHCRITRGPFSRLGSLLLRRMVDQTVELRSSWTDGNSIPM